ncbi:LysE family translocator [Taklimakanibacter lacteus]|uniref:LysE family translocator n=1 Tax=Taklimakanibacter lacteus TaxID=2268456 RepID=UPI000E66FC55
MDWQVLGAFLVATAIYLAAPCTVTAIVIGNTLNGGRPVGLRTVLGIGLGETTVLGLLGLSLLLSSRVLGDIFPWVSLASAGYLAWLAVAALRHAGGPALAETTNLSARPLLDGFAVTVSSPTAMLFYSAFFMPFAVQSDRPVLQFGILAALYISLSVAYDLTCVMLIARLVGKRLHNSAFARLARFCNAAVYLGTSALAIASFLRTVAP